MTTTDTMTPMINSMSKIEHIVYLMLENRSLDNVLGWLYDNEKDPPDQNLPSAQPPRYFGLLERTYYNLDNDGKQQWITKGTDGWFNVPSYDPYEEYEHVNNQLFETGPEPPNNPQPGKRPTMGGFYQDYYSSFDSAYQIMQTFTPEQLPVLNGLARSFAVSDNHYSSIPTQTNCNRAFAATGNSLGVDSMGVPTGWVNNHFGHFWDPKKLSVTFSQRTIWNVLTDNQIDRPQDWMIYYSQIWYDFCYTRDLLDQIQSPIFDAHFATIETFFAQAKAGNLPRFSFLEPDWGLKWWHIGQNGNDYHPPSNLQPGEQFLNSVYEALAGNKAAWEKTLLIINFDEHGGTYDHLSPQWGAPAPWASPSDGTPAPAKTEMDFKFDRYGVRVPLILVSPYVPEKLVFRVPEGMQCFDHCSVIATVLKHFGIPSSEWKLGSRVAQAQTFEDVLMLSTPRTDVPRFEPPQLRAEEANQDPPFNSLQVGIAHRVLQHAAKKIGNADALQIHYDHRFNDEIKTVSQLSVALRDVLAEFSAAKPDRTLTLWQRIKKWLQNLFKKH